MTEPTDDDVARYENASDEALDKPTRAKAAPIAEAAEADLFGPARERQLHQEARQESSDEQFRSIKRRQELDRGEAGIQAAQVENARNSQDNRLRLIFAAWVALMVTAVTEGGLIVIFAYLWIQREDIDPGVIIAWFSAQVVNTLGLAYVVARYLFPQPKQDSSRSQSSGDDSKAAE